MGKLNGVKNPALDGLISDSRRGSLIPGSRRGSGVSLGGVERRGSYYSDDVSKKATVAMVVDVELVDGKDSIFDMGVQSVQPQPAIKIQIDPNTGKLVLPDLPATNGLPTNDDDSILQKLYN